MKSEQTSYQRLLQEEGSDSLVEEQITPPKTGNVLSWALRVLLISVICVLCAAGIALLIIQIREWTSPATLEEMSCNCGSSIAEAISRGCKYDPMATSWLPQACRDDELIDQFNHAGPGPNGAWTYYTNQSGNETFTLEQVALLAQNDGEEATFWTTHEWHIAHCLFYWRKESRARMSGLAIEKSFTGEYHVQHCSDVFQSCRPLGEINTRSSAGLNSDIME